MVGYKVDEEGRALSAKAVNLDLILKALGSHFGQKSKIK